MNSTHLRMDANMKPKLADKSEGRIARRQKRNRHALMAAAIEIMSQKGIDAATKLEISELADVGAGTVYIYF